LVVHWCPFGGAAGERGRAGQLGAPLGTARVQKGQKVQGGMTAPDSVGLISLQGVSKRYAGIREDYAAKTNPSSCASTKGHIEERYESLQTEKPGR